MSVRRAKRRDPRTGAVKEFLLVDLDVQCPDGRRVRVRKVPPVQTRRGAEQYERQLRQAILDGTWDKRKEEAKTAPAESPKAVPTVREFGREFIETYARIHNKPSEQFNKQRMFHAHIQPQLGHLRLDQVGVREIDALKARLLKGGLSPKTVNNTLAMLGKMLRYAVDLGVIQAAPKVRLLHVPQQPFDYLDFAEYDRLLDAARAEPDAYAAILFAGDTGARMGELLALCWDDIDFQTNVVRISRSDWMGQVTGTKTGKVRTVPLTRRLRAALVAHRHLRGPRVFCREDGSPWTKEVLRAMLPRVCKRAGLRRIKWHTLRHTYASQLAMTGAHPREIQELGGWSTLAMVERYTHLTPARLRGAIERLEQRGRDAGPRSGEEKEFGS